MPNNPKQTETRIQQFVSAWETLRPAKTFAGLSLAAFKAKVKPSLDARASLLSLEKQLVAAQNQRDEADRTSIETLSLVVNAVKGDPAEGENGELYEAFGYVRKSERKSGLRRGTKTPAAQTKA